MASAYFQRLRSESQRFYQGLSRQQRWLMGGATAAALISLVWVGVWLQQPHWQTLYTQLDAKDAGQIVAHLKENNIPYQLETQGTGAVIQVPVQHLHELRLQMAAQNLPNEGGVVGFELFEREQMSLTNRNFDLNYQRALSGELARTIMQLEGVERARVHLAIPRKQIFTDLQDPVSASVTLKLKPLSRLSEDQVRGISKLVVSAVPGLSQEHVTITDSQGRLLFDAEQSTGRLSLNQLEMQRAYEQEIRENIERLLAKVVGSGRVSAQVKAQLNFDREESVSKTYTPNQGTGQDTVRVLRSEKESVETGQGTEPAPGGVPGTATNLPGYRDQAARNDARYERRDTTRNFEVPETQTTRVRTPGTLERLSVSIAIDSQSPAIDAPEGLDLQDPLMQNLRNLAIGAAGLDLRRGDTLAISAMPFENSAQLAAETEMQQAEQLDFWTQTVRLALLGLVALGLVIVLLNLGWRFRRKRVMAETLDDPFLPVDENLPVLQAADPALSEVSARRAQAVKGLTEMAKTDPAQMARLLRVWMDEP